MPTGKKKDAQAAAASNRRFSASVETLSAFQMPPADGEPILEPAVTQKMKQPMNATYSSEQRAVALEATLPASDSKPKPKQSRFWAAFAKAAHKRTSNPLASHWSTSHGGVDPKAAQKKRATSAPESTLRRSKPGPAPSNSNSHQQPQSRTQRSQSAAVCHQQHHASDAAPLRQSSRNSLAESGKDFFVRALDDSSRRGHGPCAEPLASIVAMESLNIDDLSLTPSGSRENSFSSPPSASAAKDVAAYAAATMPSPRTAAELQEALKFTFDPSVMPIPPPPPPRRDAYDRDTSFQSEKSLNSLGSQNSVFRSRNSLHAQLPANNSLGFDSGRPPVFPPDFAWALPADDGEAMDM